MENTGKGALPSDGVMASSANVDRHSRFEDAAEAVTSYLGNWWTDRRKLLQGLIGDLILYVCLFGYLALLSQLINTLGLGLEYRYLHRYGILIADGVILLMFIRKLAITLWNL
jgi:hypothetical protein